MRGADAERARELADVFRTQARTSREMGSALYGALLARAADDVAAGGPLFAWVRDFAGHPVLDNVPLRAMGTLHADVLAGRAPALAAFYPSAGGRFDPDPAWRALRAHVEAHLDDLRSRLDEPIQTNEVRRCCALLGGFLDVAARHRLPLRCLEIGASAGLNLAFDRYAYALGPHRFGPAEAPLVLDARWSGPPPALGAPLRVAGRAGCDRRPVDLRDPAERLRLLSYVWPDQPERVERLRRAVALAAEDPPPLIARRAGDWLPEVLAEERPGAATVVFQSVMWWYLPEAERASVTATVHAAGARARADRPLGWLRMEGARAEECEVRLLEWPGGVDRLLARAHWHGEWVVWEGAP